MSTVEETRPPITTIANGPEMNAPPPVNPSAMGIKGEDRRARRHDDRSQSQSSPIDYRGAQSLTATAILIDQDRSVRSHWSPQSRSASAAPPRRARPAGVSVISSPAIAPVAANGMETIKISGCTRLRNVPTMIMKTRAIATSMARPSWLNASR